MAQEIILPRQGQSVETCHILNWKKKIGDPVREGEVLVEVETDKATFEVESTAAGTLLHIFQGEGQDVPVLATLALVGDKGEDVSGLLQAGAGREPAAAAPETAAPTEAAPAPAQATPPEGPARGAAISPRARRLADRRGLSAAQIAGALAGGKGSGPGGRILERDVQSVLEREGAASPTAVAPAAVAPGAAEHRAASPAAVRGRLEFPGPVSEVPLKGMRKLIAGRMLESLQSTAQYSLHASASAEGLLEFRRKLKGCPEEWGLREVTVNDLMNFAVTRVLLRFPEINAHFLGNKTVRFQRVHLAVAVETPRGLMVPVVRNADGLSLRQLAAEAARLRAACLESTIAPEELGGGSFTVTNLGSLGVESFTPILNPPQVAILGVGSVQLKPVEKDGAVVFRKSIGLSLTANHQVVDGAPAARFLRELCSAVAGFELLLAG